MEKFIGGLLNCMIVSQLVLDDICSKAWSGCHQIKEGVQHQAEPQEQEHARTIIPTDMGG